ncbi:hypothetical protein GCM10022399_25230 [Terrabacter ginsenosidimutans]|uniref:Uncharacterized protein n=1 Tax=Terrabacter ginsenosidimutans TaxID=490575 RepID=A0ABP7DPZ9_9MICO
MTEAAFAAPTLAPAPMARIVMVAAVAVKIRRMGTVVAPPLRSPTPTPPWVDLLKVKAP